VPRKAQESRTRAVRRSTWPKWWPSDPTSAHWYERKHLERLLAAYIAHDEDQGRERTVREFVAEFRGLSGTAKQKKVLEATGLGRASLSALRNGDGVAHVCAMISGERSRCRTCATTASSTSAAGTLRTGHSA
jgi:hypothetical protein